MLGLFVIYWIGKRFYDLATIHNRSPWGYAILGVAIYYITQFVFGIIMYLMFPDTFSNMDKASELGLNVVGILVGAGVWYFALQYFTKKWENEADANYIEVDDEISNIGRDIES
jgi:hypothetical protein